MRSESGRSSRDATPSTTTSTAGAITTTSPSPVRISEDGSSIRAALLVNSPGAAGSGAGETGRAAPASVGNDLGEFQVVAPAAVPVGRAPGRGQVRRLRVVVAELAALVQQHL